LQRKEVKWLNILLVKQCKIDGSLSRVTPTNSFYNNSTLSLSRQIEKGVYFSLSTAFNEAPLLTSKSAKFI
jgi:hypothetical protein